jgi:hypothetical protein
MYMLSMLTSLSRCRFTSRSAARACCNIMSHHVTYSHIDSQRSIIVTASDVTAYRLQLRLLSLFNAHECCTLLQYSILLCRQLLLNDYL